MRHGVLFNLKKISVDFIAALKNTHWDFKRHIQGRYFNQQVSYPVVGHVTFCPEPGTENGLFYREDGMMDCGHAGQSAVHSEYVYRCHTESAQVSVYFVDRGRDGVVKTDRLFHPIQFEQSTSASGVVSASGLSRVKACGGHLCGNDYYQTSYIIEFSNDDPSRISSLTIMHQVTGPQKDYTSSTVFSNRLELKNESNLDSQVGMGGSSL